jgi:transposase-like protein
MCPPFKEQAISVIICIKLIVRINKIKTEVFRYLGVSKSTFSKWIKEIETEKDLKAFPREGKSKTSHEEFFFLKKALCEVKQKREILKKALPFQTREQAKQAIFEYIQACNNRQKRHSTIGYLSPVEFEKQMKVNQPVSVLTVYKNVATLVARSGKEWSIF